MYTVTFYSFKGGVGRTMALVNVAYQLAAQGRSVMMIDFDLEAPGLDTFLKPYGARPHRGVVDFVADYRSTGRAPDVSDYVYQVGAGTTPKLWYMPAGHREEKYGERLHSIDWRKLYEEEEGFLLFEDLKAQCANNFQPDYLLLDSRTGHTDVGGICTRQLPDAVTILFRLDQQNLDGLESIVQGIRNEANGPREKSIKLHFVPSSVPRTDDEHDVLTKQVQLFEKALRFDSSEVRIQNYDDLDMLENAIFSLSRPNTRIVAEYQSLAREVSRYNAEDVVGARDYLSKLVSGRGSQMAHLSDERVSVIAVKHRHDRVVLTRLAELSERQGRVAQAIDFLTEAINIGAPKSSLLIRRAELHHRLGDTEDTVSDLKAMLSIGSDSYFDVSRLVNLARRVNSALLSDLPNSKALSSLKTLELRGIAKDLLSRKGDASAALAVLHRALDAPDLSSEDRRLILSSMAMCQIHLGEHAEVLAELAESSSIQDVFNRGMASWALSRAAPVDDFNKVISIHTSDAKRSNEDANYLFCIAIALAVTGNIERSRERLNAARQAARETVRDIFSPWSYLWEKPTDFSSHIEEAEFALSSDEFVPAFIAGMTRTEPQDA